MHIRAAIMTGVIVAGLVAQGDPARLREDTLRDIGGGAPVDDLARARAKWPQQDGEIEEALARQDAARAAGEEEFRKSVAFYENKAAVRETAVSLYLYGRVLGLSGRIEEARTKFEAALKLDPFLPWAHHGLATCLATTDRLDEAAKAYRRALDLNPNFWRSYEPLSGVLMRLGRASEAEPLLRKLVVTRPGEASAWITLGKLEAFRTRYGEAAAAFEKALEIRPNNDEALRLLAFTLRKGDRLDKALEIYSRMLERNPKDYAIHIALGEVNERLGENAVAAGYFEKAAELAPAGSATESSDLQKHAQELRERPAKEKRSPRAKTPREWCEILLNSTEEERCLEAIRVLAAYPQIDEDVHKAILRSLKNPSGKVRTLAIRALADRYGPAIGELVPLLSLFIDDKDRNVRAFAVRALGDSREPSAVPALIRALSDADPYVFREAHRGLVLATPAMIDAVLPEPLDAARIGKTRADWKSWYEENRDRYRKYEPKEDGR